MDKLKKLDKRLYIVFGVVIILLVFLCALIIKKTYSISDTTSLADVNINENITFSDVKISTTDSVFKYSGYLTSNKDISDVNYINIIPEDEAGNTLATLVDYIGTNIVAGVKKEISASTNKVVLTSMHDIRYEIVKNDGSVIKVSETSLASTTTTTTTNTTTDSAGLIQCEPLSEVYSYTGDVQSIDITCSGYYKIELLGAQGGTMFSPWGGIGGKGAYTTGEILLEKGTTLYIYVGRVGKGYGSSDDHYLAFNGGGYDSGGASGGGGGSDVRLTGGTWSDSSSLASRIMIAAGGGGSNDFSIGGAGGTLIGLNGTVDGYGTGGTQVAGGTGSVAGTFGIGAPLTYAGGDGGGGGGGYYGGGRATGYYAAGGGGSSYISGYLGCVAITSASTLTPRNDTNGTQCSATSAASDVTCSYHYSDLVFSNTNMIAGDASMPTHDGTSTMTGNSGSGYAHITYVGMNHD